MTEPSAGPNKVVVRTPGRLLPSGALLEQCWDGTNAYYYGMNVHDGPASMKRYDEFVDLAANVTLAPIVDELVKKGHVALPSRPEEYGDARKLIEDIRRFIHQWVELSEEDEQLLAWYALLTHIYDKCPAMPIINFRGTHAVGKTRGLVTVGSVCYRGMRASGSLSFSSLFRNAETWKGTLLLNEGDLRDSTETSDIVKYLNERYEKGGCVWRTNPDTLTTECFDAYGPTIMTSRKEFQDPALESRCITIHMAERTRQDVFLNLPPTFYEQALGIRNKCLMFRLCNYGGFENDYSLEFEGIGSRTNQILQPLASLAQEVSPEFMKAIETFATGLQDRIAEESALSDEGLVARAFLLLLHEGTPEMPAEISSADVCNRVGWLGGRTSPVSVGKTLRRFGLNQRKASGGEKRLWEAPPHVRELLIRKYVPKDERDVFTDTWDRCDTSLEAAPDKAAPSCEEFVLGVVDAWGDSADETHRCDFRYIMGRSTYRYPDIFGTICRLLDEGKLMKREDGNIVRPR